MTAPQHHPNTTHPADRPAADDLHQRNGELMEIVWAKMRAERIADLTLVGGCLAAAGWMIHTPSPSWIDPAWYGIWHWGTVALVVLAAAMVVAIIGNLLRETASRLTWRYGRDIADAQGDNLRRWVEHYEQHHPDVPPP